jgi:hypothetical protein
MTKKTKPKVLKAANQNGPGPIAIAGAACMPKTPKVKLPRFRGHPNICVSGVHNVEEECSVFP